MYDHTYLISCSLDRIIVPPWRPRLRHYTVSFNFMTYSRVRAVTSTSLRIMERRQRTMMQVLMRRARILIEVVVTMMPLEIMSSIGPRDCLF